MIARKGSNCLPEIRHAISLLKPQALSDTTLGLTIRGIICLLTIFPWIEGMSTVRRNGRARYPPAVWNIRSRTLQMMNRTNNHLEAFHNAFKQKVGHSNPTIWGFITGMRLQQAASDNIMAAIEVGDKPPRRNARDTKKSDRLLYVTSQYSTKPLFEFLDLIADI